MSGAKRTDLQIKSPRVQALISLWNQLFLVMGHHVQVEFPLERLQIRREGGTRMDPYEHDQEDWVEFRVSCVTQKFWENTVLKMFPPELELSEPHYDEDKLDFDVGPPSFPARVKVRLTWGEFVEFRDNDDDDD